MGRYTHDIIILGGGSGGLVAASGCSQLGMKTLLIEKEHLGGDCLYYGCVPSKSLLHSAEAAWAIRSAPELGLPEVTFPAVDLGKVTGRVQDVIGSIAVHDSPERFESLGAEVVLGSPRFVSPHEIEVDGNRYSAKSIVVSTGSSPRSLPIPGLDEVGYLTNLDIFSMKELPKQLVVIGGGPIGSEMTQAFTRLGSKVTLLDVAPQILINEDADMAGIVQERLEAEGAAVKTGISIEKVERSGQGVRVILKDDIAIEADKILVAAGRQGNTEGLGLDKAGVKVERSFIPVDAKLRTSQKHIYAIGDVNGHLLFTHVAGAEASVIVRRLGLHIGGSMSYDNVPWVTYTSPEIASIGYNESRATKAGIKYRVVQESFSGNDRAHAEAATNGKIKVLVDKKDRVIGAQIAALHAGEMIVPYIYAVQNKWKLNKLMSPIYPYPTLAEMLKKPASGYYGPKLFNDKVRRILKFLFGYRGTGPTTTAGTAGPSDTDQEHTS